MRQSSYAWFQSFGLLSPAVAILLAGPVGASCSSALERAPQPLRKIYRGVVRDAKKQPIAGATVYIQTSRWLLFDTQRHVFVGKTDAKGRYRIPASYKLVGIFSWRQGYYTGLAAKDGTVQMRKLAKCPLRVRKGMVQSRANGATFSFDFASGKSIAGPGGDLTPHLPRIKQQAMGLKTPALGGLQFMCEEERHSNLETVIFETRAQPPKANYEKTIAVPQNNGPLWIRCRDGKHFAKIYLTHGSLSVDQKSFSVFFDYIYQPVPGKDMGARVSQKNFEKHFGNANWHRPKRDPKPKPKVQAGAEKPKVTKKL